MPLCEDDARLNWLDEQEQQQQYRGRVQYQYYSNGNGIASRGNLEDTDIDFNYTPVSAAYPAPTPNAYTVTGHSETLETIALQFWGDASLWYLIADANGLSGPREISVGQTLLIPNQVANVRNAADTFKPYNPSKIIGDVTPTLPLAPPAKQSCTVAQILVVAIAVVATVFTAGAAAAALAPAAAGVSAGAATGIAAMTGTLTVAGVGTAGTIAIGATAAFVGGAVGSMAGQLANGILTGAEVSGSSLMKGAVQGGLAAAGGSLLMGVGGGFRLPGSNWASIAGNMTLRAVSNPAVAAYLGSYSAGKITNSGESFSWSALAASVVGAGLAGAVTGVSPGIFGSTQSANFGQRVASGLISGASGATMQRMFNKGGKQQWGEIAANAFGQALGNSMVRYASDPGYRREVMANVREALGIEKPLSFSELAAQDYLANGGAMATNRYGNLYGLAPGQAYDVATRDELIYAAAANGGSLPSSYVRNPSWSDLDASDLREELSRRRDELELSRHMRAEVMAKKEAGAFVMEMKDKIPSLEESDYDVPPV